MAKKGLTVVVSLEEYIISSNFQVLNQVYTATFDESRPISDIIDYVVSTKTQGNVTVKVTIDGKNWSAIGPLDRPNLNSAGSIDSTDII